MCSRNAESAADLDSMETAVAPFGIACGDGYTLKADAHTIVADGADFAAKRTQCCDTTAGMCSGNAVSTPDLDQTHELVAPFGIACGWAPGPAAGWMLKADHANIEAGGGDLAAKRAQCCDPIVGMCAGNAASTPGLDQDNALVVPWGIACGWWPGAGAGWTLKDDYANINAGGGDLDAKRVQCCERVHLRAFRFRSQTPAPAAHGA